MRIVILGAGEVGSHLAKMFRLESNDVTVVDSDAGRLETLSSYVDVETCEGNPTSINVLREARVQKSDLVVSVYPSESQEINIVSALIAHKLGAGKVIARIKDEDYLTAENRLMFKELGIELLFYPEKIASDEIVESLRSLMSSETMDFARGKLQMSSYRIGEDSDLLDLRLSEFVGNLKPGEAELFRIIALRRDEETIIPKFDTKFLFGDVVYIICRRDGEELVAGFFGKSLVRVDKVMIAGSSSVARMVAETLSRSASQVTVIDSDRERCLSLSEKLPSGVRVVCGNPRDSDFLCEESITGFDAFVSLLGNDEENILSCLIAKRFGVPRTIAEVENMEYVRLAEDLGVDSIINKKLITAGRIFKYTLAGKARSVKYMSGTSAQVIEYNVSPGSAITKGALKDIDFPKGAVIGGVIRGNDSFIAVGSTLIEPYDRVAVFALPETVRELDRFFTA